MQHTISVAMTSKNVGYPMGIELSRYATANQPPIVQPELSILKIIAGTFFSTHKVKNLNH